MAVELLSLIENALRLRVAKLTWENHAGKPTATVETGDLNFIQQTNPPVNYLRNTSGRTCPAHLYC
jgi:hypothetical protein